MKNWIISVLKWSLLGSLIGVPTGFTWAHRQHDVTAPTHLPLIPFFFPEQDSPTFMGTFHTGDQRADVIKLDETSTIVLDGKPYRRIGSPPFAGSPGVAANSACSFVIAINDYLGSERTYDEVQKQTYWKSSLTSGKHILTVTYGG